MSTETWLQLLIPIVGIVAAIISAAATYYFTKKAQSNLEERHLKETYYIEYIKAVSNIVITNNTEKARDTLADKQNQLLLVGSSKVVSALMDFHNYLKPSSQEIHGMDSDIHDALLTNLIKAMREDLYYNRNINKGYPTIHLTGKAPQNTK